MVGIAAVLAFLYPAANPSLDYLVSSDGVTETIVRWNTAILGVQPSETDLATTQASAAYQTFISPVAVLQHQRDAAAGIVESDHSAPYKALRGAAAVLVDELNVIREWTVNFKTEVAAATSLANLQTRVATLPSLPDRTLAQAKSAIEAKITAGVVD